MHIAHNWGPSRRASVELAALIGPPLSASALKHPSSCCSSYLVSFAVLLPLGSLRRARAARHHHRWSSALRSSRLSARLRSHRLQLPGVPGSSGGSGAMPLMLWPLPPHGPSSRNYPSSPNFTCNSMCSGGADGGCNLSSLPLGFRLHVVGHLVTGKQVKLADYCHRPF
jgi:hypothetical protein